MRRILILSDDSALHDGLAWALRAYEFQVDTTNDPETAFQLIKRQGVQALLTHAEPRYVPTIHRAHAAGIRIATVNTAESNSGSEQIRRITHPLGEDFQLYDVLKFLWSRE